MPRRVIASGVVFSTVRAGGGLSVRANLSVATDVACSAGAVVTARGVVPAASISAAPMVVPPAAAIAPAPRVIAPAPRIAKAHAQGKANAEAAAAAPPTITAPIGAGVEAVVAPTGISVETPTAEVISVTWPVSVRVWIAAVAVPGVVVGDVGVVAQHQVLRADRTGIAVAGAVRHRAVILIAIHVASGKTESHAVSVRVVDLHVGSRIDRATWRNAVDLFGNSVAERPWSVRCACNKPRGGIAQVIHLLAIDERRAGVRCVLHGGAGDGLEARGAADGGEFRLGKCAIERCHMGDGLLIDGLSGLRRVGHGGKHIAPCSVRINLCE